MPISMLKWSVCNCLRKDKWKVQLHFQRFSLHNRRLGILTKQYSQDMNEQSYGGEISKTDLQTLKQILPESAQMEHERFTEGYCNAVYKMTGETETYVVKKYSSMSSLRCELSSCVRTHELLAELDISPKFIAYKEDLIVTEYVNGRALKEDDMYQASISRSLALIVSTLHKLDIGERNEPLVWKWLDTMLLQLGKMTNLV
jgi:hypothetical protein